MTSGGARALLLVDSCPLPLPPSRDTNCGLIWILNRNSEFHNKEVNVIEADWIYNALRFTRT